MIHTKSLFSPVLLITGILISPKLKIKDIFTQLEQSFNNSIESVSEPFPFDHSNYYEPEMGPNLQRLFVCFKDLIDPETGYLYKCRSNQIETQFSIKNNRYVNLDPGILSMHNLLLYSTKNYSHRIPCNKGIYAELTVLFKKHSVKTLQWTYPDFKQQAIQQFLLEIRKQYSIKLKKREFCHDA